MAKRKTPKEVGYTEEVAPLDGTQSNDKTDIEGAEASKSDLIGYRGGLDVNLSRVMESGQTLETELAKDIGDELDNELRNQEKLVRNIARAERQYIGRKKGKSFPWQNCANISVPETRKNVDTVLVRLLDAIFNRRKIFLVKAKKPELMEQARAIENALDWFFKHIIRLKEKLLPALMQGLKSGTGIVHVTWESKKDTVYRYATPEEVADKSVHKYKTESGENVVKSVQTYYEGPQWIPVPREDFIISSDATSIKEARLVGFRAYMTEKEIRQNERQGVYRKGCCEKLIAPDKVDETKESRAENQGKEIRPTDKNRPYEIWTLWLKHDVDEDGESDSIVVTFHPYSKTILRCLYNPVFTKNRPFIKVVPWPVEYSFDGDGICNAMYHIQEAIDAIQNQRLDRGTLLNSYVTLSRAGIGLDNFRFAPGKHYVCDENPSEDVFRVIQVPDVSPSQFQEQANLASLGERMVGISPAMQGMSMSERPVAKETFALIEEANKKFKSQIDYIREDMVDGAYQTLEMMAQYQPTLRFKEKGDSEEWIEQTVDIPVMSLREGFDIELAASSEVLSQEVRREIWLNVFMLIRQYQTDLGGMAQMLTSPNVPSDMKQVILDADKIGVQLLKNILLDYDLPNAEELVLDLSKSVNVQKAMAMSADMRPPMPPMPTGGPGGPGAPPIGPSGPGGPPKPGGLSPMMPPPGQKPGMPMPPMGPQ